MLKSILIVQWGDKSPLRRVAGLDRQEEGPAGAGRSGHTASPGASDPHGAHQNTVGAFTDHPREKWDV